jgi:acyl-CoA synthetase (AMP-forming)/AMP-acid ligase II
VLTLRDALAVAAESPWGLRFVDPAERELLLSWRDVRRRARLVAGALALAGVAPGDRVAIVLPTGPDFMDAFFGALLAGAVPVPLYPPVRLARLEEYHPATARMLQLVGARLVLTDARVRRLLGRATALARPELGCVTVESLRESGAAPLEVPGDPDAPGVIQYSSGSTVDPKPVSLSQRALLAHCAVLEALLLRSATGPQLGVSWLPLYHDMGLIGALLTALYHPADLVLIAPEHFLARPALWLRCISRYRATVSPAPNFAYSLCVRRVRDADLAGVDLSTWRVALNGAEPVSADTMRRFAERFARVGFDGKALMPVYGLSEAALALTFTSPDEGARVRSVDPARLAAEGVVVDGDREIVSVGRCLPGCEIELRGGEGGELPEGRVGRLYARSVSMMTGYFAQPEATAATLDDGWLDTGDLGFVEDGEVYICGRAKDVVIIRGANHAPQDFEDALAGIEGLRPGCAVAAGFVPRGEGEEALLILAERYPDAPGGLEEVIRASVVARTGVRAHTVTLLDPGALPRTSSGKLRRREALRRFEAGELTAPRPATAVGLAVEVARSAIAFARTRAR